MKRGNVFTKEWLKGRKINTELSMFPHCQEGIRKSPVDSESAGGVSLSTPAADDAKLKKHVPPSFLKLLEKDFQKWVIDLAHLYGWSVAHFYHAKKTVNGVDIYVVPVAEDGKGWPDLVMVRERVIYAELKSQKGKPTPEQREWLSRLWVAEQEVYIWKPSDREKIKEILR